MNLEEVRVRLLDALRNGRLSIDLKGVVLGFAKAVKDKAERGKKGPSNLQIEVAQKLVREIKYHDGTEPVDLIDYDDNETGHEQADDYAEF